MSCGQASKNGHERSEFVSLDNQTGSRASVLDTAIINEAQPKLDTLESLEIFKSFALNYSPKNESWAKLPEPSDTVLRAIDLVKVTYPQEYEKHLILIFLKLYSAHLECCHQSYDVRQHTPIGIDPEKDPLVYEFNDLTKYFPVDKPIEFISSHLVHEYVLSNKHLVEFPPIKEHLQIIEQIEKNIEEGVYWK